MRRFLSATCLLLLAMPVVAAAQDKAGDLFVLAVNGGGDKQDNFASHLGHLRQLVELLHATGVPRDHITVLSSDGQDPSPDLATREADPENAWLLQGTRLDPLLRDLTSYENSALPGVDLRPATIASLTQAVAELRARMRAGDTLLVYVTDHGSQDRRDPLGNRITLWGAREAISVRKLGTLLARLPSTVRVVSLMSQCYSGGFAYLHEVRERRRIPSGQTCGYFSSTPDRPAYGCYPEVRGQKAIGHAFEFLSALARRGRFSAAHADVLVSDETPDIPLRSSDVYLAERLARAAGTPARETAFLAPLVDRAFSDPELLPALRQIDQLAARYDLHRPSSLEDLDQQADALFDLLDQTEAYAKTWESALGDFNQANLDGFLAGQPAWRSRLEARALRGQQAPTLRSLATALLDELERFVTADPERTAEANRLVTALSTADQVSYRNEIRIAAIFRIRFILTTAAGRVWIRGNRAEAKAFEALNRCEDLTLSLKPLDATGTDVSTADRFPALSLDRQRADTIKPGWLGITFVPVGAGRRKRLGLPDGASQVTAVLPHSPAAGAGIRAGDIITGAHLHAFSHKGDLRPLIVSTRPGSALAMEVLRGKQHLSLRPTVGEAPAANQ